MISCWIVLNIIAFYNPHGVTAATDSRFYGTYCGEGHIPYETPLGRTRTAHLRDIKLHLEYKESGNRGIVHGRGVAYYEGQKIPFVVGGSVIRRGVVKGLLQVPGEDPYRGEVHLSGDGLTITVDAMRGRIILHKDHCGNTPPVVHIASPRPRSEKAFGDIVTFSATVDDEDPVSDFSRRRLIWTSDLMAEPIGHGTRVSTTDLVPGNHKIRFTAIDRGGLEGRDEIDLIVFNTPPYRPIIVSPENGDRFRDCQEIIFRGRASDPEQGFLPGSYLSWQSSIDRELGQGREISAYLSTGTHRITLTATDNAGATRSSEINIAVSHVGGNCPPTPQIIAPDDISVFLAGSTIEFYGRAYDTEDEWIPSANLQWRLSWIGPDRRLRSVEDTGAHVSITAPSVDIDTRIVVTLTAIDSGLASGEDKISIYVIPMLY